ncbi:MAG: lipocalin family protein [bacterium]|nr:lipocalin family protein [bacterium]
MVQLFYILMVLCSSTLAAPVFGEPYREVRPGDEIVLPSHLYYQPDYRVQWWYVTGHLADEGGREFGYELTFFAVGVRQRAYRSRFGLNTIYISHFAISDVAGRRFTFHDESDRGAFGFAGAHEEKLAVWVGANRLEGSLSEMVLHAEGGQDLLDLSLVPGKPCVRNGEKGYARKSETSPLVASLYFSCTRLATEGVLRLGDGEYKVTGTSWFDRELASRDLDASALGWDWFALQLDNGEEVMLYAIRRADGSTGAYSSGTMISRSGESRHLKHDDFEIITQGHYTSKKTRARYPSKWRVVVPSEGLDVTVVPQIEDQEFLAPHTTWNAYWEGTCTVDGSHRGRAYVEMTGY